ncbi:MAG: hypothetical protein A2Y78_04800 [Acidobacteria bacterium RBG_13_68_16]|nr:MAG: hypothetical protein A2Y78_04800 [Acidobacteria bacterium RBG_13_68_16]
MATTSEVLISRLERAIERIETAVTELGQRVAVHAAQLTDNAAEHHVLFGQCRDMASAMSGNGERRSIFSRLQRVEDRCESCGQRSALTRGQWWAVVIVVIGGGANLVFSLIERWVAP